VINIVEIRKPELGCPAGRRIGSRSSSSAAWRFRRAMSAPCSRDAARCRGIRINCSGRLGGAEIARMEWYREGRVPLHRCARMSTTASHRVHDLWNLRREGLDLQGEIMEHDPMAQDKRWRKARRDVRVATHP